MRAVSEEMITLLGTLDFCMAKRNDKNIGSEKEMVSEEDKVLQMFKDYLSSLSLKEREAILDELQRYVWLHDVA